MAEQDEIPDSDSETESHGFLLSSQSVKQSQMAHRYKKGTLLLFGLSISINIVFVCITLLSWARFSRENRPSYETGFTSDLGRLQLITLAPYITAVSD